MAGPSPGPRAGAADNVGRGIAFACGYAGLVPVSESAAKVLGETTAAPQITLVRFLIHMIVLGGYVALFVPRAEWRPRPLWPVALRGLCQTMGTFFVYAGLAVLPLADAVAIFFILPLLITALSALILREHVGRTRWAAVAFGMTGAMLIIGPNFNEVGWGATLPVLAALFHAFSALLTRRFASAARLAVFQLTASVIAIALASVVLAAGALAGIAAVTPHMPTEREIGLLVIVAFASMATNLMLTQSFRIAPASVIAPLLYLHIVGSAVAGYVVFAQIPGTLTLIGGTMVVSAGLTVWWRESRPGAAPA